MATPLDRDSNVVADGVAADSAQCDLETFNHESWEDEQRRLTAMFNSMYEADDDEDAADDQEEPLAYTEASGLNTSAMVLDERLEDLDVVPWRPGDKPGINDTSHRLGSHAAQRNGTWQSH